MKACYRNYLGPIVLMITGLVMALLLSKASGAPPPSHYAKVGLVDAGVDEVRAQVDADIPQDDGLGTSPSWAERVALAGSALGAFWTLVSITVALTPTQKDDEALSRARAFLEKWSFLNPRNVPGLFSFPGKAPRRNPEGV